MNIEDFKIAALSQGLLDDPNYRNFWTFNLASSALTGFNVTLSSGNIKIFWGDGTLPTVTNSNVQVNHDYTI
jgi:hypothetical protein